LTGKPSGGQFECCIKLAIRIERHLILEPHLEGGSGSDLTATFPSPPGDTLPASDNRFTVTFDLQPVLTGDFLQLRPMQVDDFDELFRVAADPLIWEQHPEPNRCEEPIFRKFFDQGISSGGGLVAIDRTTGQIIGSSRYHDFDATHSVVEIGYTFLARAYWGGRYNGEMKRLMLEHAFRWVTRVRFVIGPDNWRSRRAVEKIGGVLAGTTNDSLGRERVVYELTPALYAGTKKSHDA
jgi:RimJ/RimL family protein N-acetyltransferase